MSDNADSGVFQAELEVADTVGRLMEFWGFKRPMGRMWTLLYLSPQPLGAAEIGGEVKKSWRPGERRDFYEAETSVGKLVQRVLRERELTLVQQFAEALGRAEAELPETTTKQAEALAFKRERLQHLRALSQLGEGLLRALVSGQAIDPT